MQPRDGDPLPVPRNGSATAKSTNGSSIIARRSSQPGPTRASAATAATSSAYPPKAQNASRGVATTATVKTTIATILTSGGSRCTGEALSRYSTCP